ncbi:hypothetical protein L596_020645 [Steinernema carpocapsae]|uniref:Uncharacterized protein n=1 Tax=Steinernema carpocapsae TaxID=34508 RepID=A0A4V6A0Y5_STECR|nr:hypothetical protein L596_020645 [Steinernema carpocapsae]
MCSFHLGYIVAVVRTGIRFVVFLMTPYSGYVVTHGHFLTHYDILKPYCYVAQKKSAIFILCVIILTLIVYLDIIVFLISLKTKFKTSTVKMPSKVKTILIYAVVRFLFDVTL